MIRKSLFAASALIALTTVASAADVSMPSAYDWSGFYAGLNAGYAWGQAKGTDENGWLVFPDYASSLTAKGDGLTAGGQMGYNLQHDGLVFGVEADLSYLDVSGSKTSSLASDNHVVSDVGYLGTLRGRLGFAADRFMIYGTGGLALGDTGSYWLDNGGTYQFKTDTTGSQLGWVAGAGLEYAATDSISVKAEYLHYDLGSESFDYSGGPLGYCDQPTCTFKIKNSGDIVRVGLNFQF